ncbi:MAG: nickel-responsive transcriptional regulator NikR [Phycisphaerae bacterium]|nr:nickel-responsive transcriptional regulator NikR [Phycisphaerae bacterium]
MSSLERVGVSLDQHLLAEFDQLTAKQGYTNRSEAIRDLIRDRLSAEQLEKPTANAVAGIFLVYDHHSTALTNKLLHLQHDHVLNIVASTHIHLDHHNCLEIIIVKDKVQKIQALADKMGSLKGVKLSKTNMISIT